MASLEQKIRAEVRMRELLEENGLTAPDGVEYGFGCVRFFFAESKTCVVVDIDDYTEVDRRLGLAPPT
jgi:hypothetical protein